MSETSLRELQPASENPWYKLATDAGKDHADNTRRWNGYMRHLIGEEKATNLKRAEGAPKELPLLSPDEIEQIREDIPDNISLSWISLSGLLFAEAVNFQDFYFPVFVDFTGSRFAEYANFTGSTFAGAVNFTESRFAEYANFRESTFAESADFTESTFAGDAGFRGSTFVGPANFRGSTFAGPASFRGSRFAEYANFTGSTFAGPADFEKRTFAGDASFTASRFAEYANFTGSTFAGPARFKVSTFAGAATFTASCFAEYADFEKSSFAGPTALGEITFKGPADFRGSAFKGPADFKKSIFTGDAIFRKSTFTGTVDFSNSEYRGKTSFQNVTFTRAPLFFATTLHEDTDWTDVDWPAKPADKEDAIQYVRRYDRLALIMSTLKQPDNEHRFFRLSMQAKEVRDGEGINTGVSRLYGRFFCYGWGLERALKLWVLHILLGAGCLSVVPPCTMSYPLSGLTALVISFSNSLPFLGLHRGPAKSAYASFDTLTGFNILWTIQSVIGPVLLFFLLLTIRNRFRLR